MKKLLLVLIVLFHVVHASAQTFSGTGGNIPDDGSSIRFPITVSGLPSSIDSTFGLIHICLNIVHPYVSDLNIWLIAPDSTYIELSTGNGGSGDNYWNTCFYDTVPAFITNGNAPFSGSFRPESPMYNVNNGQQPNSTWQLLIHDTYPFADAGILTTWTIGFSNNPPQGLVLQSSNLPIIKISTFGQAIPDDPKITALMQIIDNGMGIRNYSSDPPTTYNGTIGIEVRGSSSQMFPKKSYGIETRDSSGNDLDTSLFGMPPESDWILGANYTDKSFMRNVLAYDRARAMGHYATRTQYCELILNGQYQGIYVFTEKIKRGPGRVDIAKMTPTDTSGDDLTGGYILKIDKNTGSGGGGGWITLFNPPNGGPKPNIQHEYPDITDILPVQSQYIEEYCDSFEIALHGPSYTDPVNGYRKFIDINSWIDYLLLNELSKNVDGYRISTFFSKAKDSDGGKLHMGPVWDYDIAWGNADYYGGDVTTGYSYQFTNTTDGNQVPFWWSRLMQDTSFRNAVRCRWDYLRNNVLSTATLHNWIDSVGMVLDESQGRNFSMWPILGVYVWPNPSPFPPDYTGVKQELKNWISNRSSWMDANLPGSCIQTGTEMLDEETSVLAYPNPAKDYLLITLPADYQAPVQIRIRNILGQYTEAKAEYSHAQQLRIDLKNVAEGIYVTEILLGEKMLQKVFVKRL